MGIRNLSQKVKLLKNNNSSKAENKTDITTTTDILKTIKITKHLILIQEVAISKIDQTDQAIEAKEVIQDQTEQTTVDNVVQFVETMILVIEVRTIIVTMTTPKLTNSEITIKHTKSHKDQEALVLAIEVEDMLMTTDTLIIKRITTLMTKAGTQQ